MLRHIRDIVFGVFTLAVCLGLVYSLSQMITGYNAELAVWDSAKVGGRSLCSKKLERGEIDYRDVEPCTVIEARKLYNKYGK